MSSNTNFVLVVIHPFGTYAKGVRITDPEAIAAVLAGETARNVNRVPAPAVTES